jgi:aryl-alcohol dehydrogenase-like predicted oxidoreductase
MQLLQQQGKIRYWGLSLNTFDPLPEASFLIEKKSGNGFQLVLNLLNQKALDLFPAAAENGYGIIARMPLQFGLLTGKFDNGVSFSNNDHRKNRLTASVIDTANKALQPVWELCANYNCSKTQLAMSYILSYPEVSTIIPGIRTPEQVNQNTTGLFKLLPEHRLLIVESGKSSFVEVMQLIQQQG